MPNGKDRAEKLQQLANSGDIDAAARLGYTYLVGWGIPPNLETAERWLKIAAARLDTPPGLWAKGLCYHREFGVTQDSSKAQDCFEKAASQNYAPAANSFALYCEQGTSMPKQMSKAIHFYQLAVTLEDYAPALNNLAGCYQSGEGIEKDAAIAAKLYQRAADQGLATAQFNFARCLEQGKGVTKDLVKARVYFEMAAKLGDADAKQKLTTLPPLSVSPHGPATSSISPAISADLPASQTQERKQKAEDTQLQGASQQPPLLLFSIPAAATLSVHPVSEGFDLDDEPLTEKEPDRPIIVTGTLVEEDSTPENGEDSKSTAELAQEIEQRRKSAALHYQAKRYYDALADYNYILSIKRGDKSAFNERKKVTKKIDDMRKETEKSKNGKSSFLSFSGPSDSVTLKDVIRDAKKAAGNAREKQMVSEFESAVNGGSKCIIC